MSWEDIVKQDAGELVPLLDKLTQALENRIREMEAFLEDSEEYFSGDDDEYDEAYALAEVILLFTERANGTGDMPRFGLTDAVRNLIKLIDKRYAELVEMMR